MPGREIETARRAKEDETERQTESGNQVEESVAADERKTKEKAKKNRGKEIRRKINNASGGAVCVSVCVIE